VPSDCQGPLLDTQMVKLKSKMPAVPHHEGGAVERQGWTGVPLARHAPARLACYRSCLALSLSLSLFIMSRLLPFMSRLLPRQSSTTAHKSARGCAVCELRVWG